ncbi:FtsL-like putative cell division protein [Robertkochia aurantiaca]|uniref:FtsL-like putative cell division protein n=1 Tax=Robertkochia aurantiaca TaxID=2873700 RepID=UPI002105F111|nr:FtsL-like putative cell division protein [Robertkochia sp. 3YJGBD-33]
MVKRRLLDLLKGKFLISEDSFRNWRFIIFASLLAGVMITSAHRADQKVHDLARLSEEVLELRSEFVDTRTRVQQARLESNVVSRVKESGLKPSEVPPKVIKVAVE